MGRFRILVLLLVASAASDLRAQSTGASVGGRVVDASQAPIGEAAIVAVRADTNVRYAARTSVAGEYFLANLPPGSYRLEVERPGFKKVIKPDLVLHVQDAVRIDLEMAVGPVAETVTVEAGGSPVNATSGTVVCASIYLPACTSACRSSIATSVSKTGRERRDQSQARSPSGSRLASARVS